MFEGYGYMSRWDRGAVYETSLCADWTICILYIHVYCNQRSFINNYSNKKYIPFSVTDRYDISQLYTDMLQCLLTFSEQVAEFCLIIRNFNSFINVMRGLQFYSVYCQGVVWEKLQRNDPNICQ